MSKSRGNVVNPDDVVGQVGADAVRCFLMFIGPWDQGGPWSDEGINGVVRWLNRVWGVVERDPNELDASPADAAAVRDTQRALHQTIRKCYEDLDKFKFNTTIASLMELVNHLSRVWNDGSVDSTAWRDSIEKFLLMLAPIAPHVAEEWWERTGHGYSIHQQPFPAWDDELASEDELTLVVQVNGRLRDRITVPASIGDADARERALESPKVQSHIDGKTVRNVVYVPGRLVNVVVG
jgi:leucyl-tRNA synthetase